VEVEEVDEMGRGDRLGSIEGVDVGVRGSGR